MVWTLFVLFLIINSGQYSECNPLESEDQNVTNQDVTNQDVTNQDAKNQSESIDLSTLKKAADDYEKCMLSTLSKIGDQLNIDNKLYKLGYSELFKKACNNIPEFLKCHQIYNKIFDRIDEYKERLVQTEQYLKDTFDYLCYNNSERIQLFIMNDGFDCLTKEKTINNCGPAGGFEFIGYIQVAVNPTLLIPAMRSDQERFCQNAQSYWNCVVQEMETCESKIPANAIKGLVKHVLKHNACNQFLNQQQ